VPQVAPGVTGGGLGDPDERQRQPGDHRTRELESRISGGAELPLTGLADTLLTNRLLSDIIQEV
jgi:hypothetical protein